ncbi:MAG: hypothetical protein ACOC2C_05380, partial [Cyclonatronaceae bacterium]
MNRPETRFFAAMMAAGAGLLLVLLLVFFATAFYAGLFVPAEGQETSLIWAFLLLFGLLTAALYAGLRLFFERFIVPVNRLADAIEAYDEPDWQQASGFRQPQHHRFVRTLAEGIERMKTAYDTLKADTAGHIKAANEKAEREKQTLATLVSQLQSGIILCAADGRITLYNSQVSALMQTDQSRARLGLGKRLDGLFDAGLIHYLIEEC